MTGGTHIALVKNKLDRAISPKSHFISNAMPLFVHVDHFSYMWTMCSSFLGGDPDERIKNLIGPTSSFGDKTMTNTYIANTESELRCAMRNGSKSDWPLANSMEQAIL